MTKKVIHAHYRLTKEGDKQKVKTPFLNSISSPKSAPRHETTWCGASHIGQGAGEQSELADPRAEGPRPNPFSAMDCVCSLTSVPT